jgi:hypothetical protein
MSIQTILYQSLQTIESLNRLDRRREMQLPKHEVLATMAVNAGRTARPCFAVEPTGPL